MIFDAQNIFFGTSPYTSAANYVSLAALTASGTSSTVINMGVAQDMGIGTGVGKPQVAIRIGTGITSASTGLLLNWQFQGSTDSTNWTTYMETGAKSTASWIAGAYVFRGDVPPRPSGVALPQYYRVNMAVTGITNETITIGTLFGGIVLNRDDAQDTLGLYPSGFSVAS